MTTPSKFVILKSMKRRVFILVCLVVTLAGLFHGSKVLAANALPVGASVGARAPAVYDQTQYSVIDGLSGASQGNWTATPQILYELSTIWNAVGMQAVGAKDANGNTLVNGATQFFAGGIATMASLPPASSGDYIKYMAGKVAVPGVPTPAYAAGPGGTGFSSLTPVLQIWSAFRNLAYVLFAVIFIVIGLMIMLRVKIDPKTTATIQSALPKIVFALVLVTFSYAIAGFFVDLMYASTALLLTILKGIAGTSFGTNFEKDVLSGQTIFSFFVTGANLDPRAPITPGTGGLAVSVSAFNAVSQVVAQLTGNLGIFSQILGGISGGIAFLVVAIAILWALFKTWIMLIGAYANIILSIVFAPLQLMVDAIPGQNQFSGWARGILANLLAFPVTIAFMFVALALSAPQVGIAPVTPQTGFVPPLIGGNSQSAVQALLGIGILLTIPKVLEMLQEAFKAPKYKFGSAWQDAMKFGWNQTGGRVVPAAYQELYMGVVGRYEQDYQTFLSEHAKWAARGRVGRQPSAPPRPNAILRGVLPRPK